MTLMMSMAEARGGVSQVTRTVWLLKRVRVLTDMGACDVIAANEN
jgi:hypothetical protein